VYKRQIRRFVTVSAQSFGGAGWFLWASM